MRFVDETDVAAMRKEGDLVDFIKLGLRQGRTQAAQRRALILRHPDLAQKLTEQPINCPTPELWDGALPPEMWREERNDSPRRPAILALITEATRREQK